MKRLEPPDSTSETESDPHEPQHLADSGVDLTLIQWMLSLTPDQRLQAAQDQLNAIESWKEQLDSD